MMKAPLTSVMNRLRTWIGSQIATVPADIECCEFDCDKPTCSNEEIEACERRRNYAKVRSADATGQPSPSPRSPLPPSPPA
jgi:hypothetical protein